MGNRDDGRELTPGEVGARDDPLATTRVVLRPIASPLALGFLGLAGARPWAAELEDVTRRTLLPVGRRGTGKEAVGGGFFVQTKQVTKEPGVREQL